MPFCKTFLAHSLPLLLTSVIWHQGVTPALADDNNQVQGKSGEAETTAGTTTNAADATTGSGNSATDLARRPVNEKILPLIKEGYGYLSKGMYEQAIKVLNTAVSMDKKSISPRRYLAYALIQKGEPKEALAQMKTVSSLVPPNAFDFYLFATAYYAAGGDKEASDCYNEALRQDPAYDAARAGLVKTLARQHNFEEALNNVQIGLQLTKDQTVKKYYTSLSKAVIEAQTSQQQVVGGTPTAVTPMSTQAGGDSVKSRPIVIK